MNAMASRKTSKKTEKHNAANADATKKKAVDGFCRLPSRFQKAWTKAKMATRIMAMGVMTREYNVMKETTN
jgi:hypothetical protein